MIRAYVFLGWGCLWGMSFTLSHFPSHTVSVDARSPSKVWLVAFDVVPCPPAGCTVAVCGVSVGSPESMWGNAASNAPFATCSSVHSSSRPRTISAISKGERSNFARVWGLCRRRWASRGASLSSLGKGSIVRSNKAQGN